MPSHNNAFKTTTGDKKTGVDAVSSSIEKESPRARASPAPGLQGLRDRFRGYVDAPPERGPPGIMQEEFFNAIREGGASYNPETGRLDGAEDAVKTLLKEGKGRTKKNVISFLNHGKYMEKGDIVDIKDLEDGTINITVNQKGKGGLFSRDKKITINRDAESFFNNVGSHINAQYVTGEANSPTYNKEINALTASTVAKAELETTKETDENLVKYYLLAQQNGWPIGKEVESRIADLGQRDPAKLAELFNAVEPSDPAGIDATGGSNVVAPPPSQLPQGPPDPTGIAATGENNVVAPPPPSQLPQELQDAARSPEDIAAVEEAKKEEDRNAYADQIRMFNKNKQTRHEGIRINTMAMGWSGNGRYFPNAVRNMNIEIDRKNQEELRELQLNSPEALEIQRNVEATTQWTAVIRPAIEASISGGFEVLENLPEGSEHIVAEFVRAKKEQLKVREELGILEKKIEREILNVYPGHPWLSKQKALKIKLEELDLQVSDSHPDDIDLENSIIEATSESFMETYISVLNEGVEENTVPKH